MLLRFIRAKCGVRKLPNNVPFCSEGYFLILSVDHVRLIPQSIPVALMQYLELCKDPVLVRHIVLLSTRERGSDAASHEFSKARRAAYVRNSSFKFYFFLPARFNTQKTPTALFAAYERASSCTLI